MGNELFYSHFLRIFLGEAETLKLSIFSSSVEITVFFLSFGTNRFF